MSYLFKHVTIIQPFRMLHKACFAKKLTHPTAYSHVLMPLLLSLSCVLRWPRSSGMNCDKFANVVAVGVTTDLNTDKFRCTQPNPNQTKLYLSLTVLMRHGQVQKHPNLTKLNTCQLSSTDLHMDKFRCIQTKPNYSSFTNLHMDKIGALYTNLSSW